MADDRFARPYRSTEPPRRDPRFATPSHQPDSDPLAELARLIGQSDPFAEFGRNAPAPDPRYAEPRDAHHRAPPFAAPEPRRGPVSAYETLQHQAAPAPRDDYADPHRGGGPGHFGHGGMRAATPAADHVRQDYAADAYRTDDHFADAHQDQHYGEPHPDQYYAEADRFADDGPFAGRGQNLDYGHQPSGAYQAGHYRPAMGQAGLDDDAIYDDPPRARRQSGLFTALLLIGCAVVGTAAAYGYRSYSVSRAVQAPPVITADTAPSKVVPAAAEAQSGKAIQERLGDQSANERIVSHQEEPVQLKDPSTPPRVVLPAPVAPGMPPSGSPSSIVPPSSAVPQHLASPSSEPKKVRTVTIRPDGSDPSARPVAAAPPSISPVTSRPAVAPATKQAARGGPLSLDPQAQPEPPAQPAPVSRTASIPPAPAAGTPTQLAPAAASTSGGYVVQLSSQRSETDAQASFRSLQAKFPNVLGDREVIIRRADLGQKGTYFRAMVGPFASSGEAEQLCGSLKAAGGQCIIQKN
jgi:hypothetical protein